MTRPGYVFSSRLFLKGLALIYFIAFASLGVQILGLSGAGGISPAREYLDAVAKQFGAERYWLLPTLVWLNASDFFLQFLCWGGACLLLLLFFGFAPALLSFLLWLFYLSLVTVGQDFLSFQWDNLLLETGFLAIFLSPLGILPKSNRDFRPSPVVLALLNWLLFRLIFSSGAVKLASGDPTWRNLTALTYHYQTQPLPTWIGWYAHQLPPAFQKISCLMMFAIELVVPFFIFLGRWPRIFASFAFIFLQLLIFFTGNYCFFNPLAILLVILLLDDNFWLNIKKGTGTEDTAEAKSWPKVIVWPLAVVIFLASYSQIARFMPIPRIFLAPSFALERILFPFRTINSYGLFAVMTTERAEIIVESSEDGENWKAYRFKYKPGDLKSRPEFVEPHQPRLDWQMWFAALGNFRENPWFVRFCLRLLEGSPAVLRLLAKNPFPDRPPKYVRAVLYDYQFTNPVERQKTGAWWRRELKGLYLPAISLKN